MERFLALPPRARPICDFSWRGPSEVTLASTRVLLRYLCATLRRD